VWAGALTMTSSTAELVDDERLLPGVEPSAAVWAMQRRII